MYVLERKQPHTGQLLHLMIIQENNPSLIPQMYAEYLYIFINRVTFLLTDREYYL